MKAGLMGIIAGLLPGKASAKSARLLLNPTPPEIKGPFYPVMAQKDKDFDLTIIEGNSERAKGQVVIIEGNVIGVDGQAISDASVELWQANAAGRYDHPHDSNKAPVDPNFQGWAIVPSGGTGGFRFKTIYPGTYPVSADWLRPPHIHFKVSKLGYVELITQMYFSGHELNEIDRLIKRKSVHEQELMMAIKSEDNNPKDKNLDTYKYNIILQKA